MMTKRLCALLLVAAAVAGVALAADSLLLFSPTRWTYLLLDRFITDDAAPLSSPRTCEPGPGTLTVNDTTNKLSVSGGVLACATPAGGVMSDPAVWGPQHTRAAGRAFLLQVTRDSSATFSYAGLNRQASPNVGQSAVLELNGTTATYYDFATGASPALGTVTAGATLDLAFVERSMAGVGLFVLEREPGGLWRILWVDNSMSGNPYPFFSSFDAAISWDNARVVDIASWSSDDKIYTDYEASPAAETTMTMTADALVDWSMTLDVARPDFNISVRRTSDNDRWNLAQDAGGNLSLNEIVGGSSTSRAVGLGVASGAARFVYVLDGNVHKVYANNTLELSYTDPSSYHISVTGVKLDQVGPGSSFDSVYTWPRYPAFPGGV